MSDSSPVLDVKADAVLERICALVLALPAVGEGPIAGDTRFDALGLDSVDRLELLVAVEDRFGVVLPDEYLTSPTVGDVAAAIRELLAAASGPEGSREGAGRGRS